MNRMQLIFIISIFALFSAAVALVQPSMRRSRVLSVMARREVGTVSEIPNGERKIIDTDNGAVIITNLGGSFFAVNAKCPHLGLPMKKGAIGVEDGKPTITCNFHNSKFSLEDGSCSAWCTGVLGLPNSGFFGGAMGKIGGAANTPATVYLVTVEEGKLFVDL